MRMIDFHTHAFPDKIASKAVEQLSKATGGMPYHTLGTYASLENAAKQAGLTHYVVLPIAVKQTQMRTVNDVAYQNKTDMAIQFASIHPYADDVYEEIDRIKAMGFQGVKLHPEYQNFHVDDERVFPVYHALAEQQLITVFHAGYDLGYAGEAKASPAKLKKALPHFEGVPVVAAHMGGHADWMNVLALLAGEEGLYLDTSFSFTHIPPRAAEKIIEKHGATHILFGSDSPWSDIRNEIKFIEQLSLPDTSKEMIFYKNAERLLDL